MSGVDMNDLADVSLGFRPVQLEAPRLVDPRYLFRHAFSLLNIAPHYVRGPTFVRDDRNSPSSFSTSVAVRARRVRAATRVASAALNPRSACFASGTAVGAMLNSVSPRPTRSVSTIGSAAISPHTDTGIPRRRAARGTSRRVRTIAGCNGSYKLDTRSSVRSTARVY